LTNDGTRRDIAAKIMKTPRRSIFLQLLAVVCVVSLGLAVAHANSVTFDTTGAFNGSGNSISFGSGGNTLQITFTGVSTVNLNDTPFTFTSLGQFQTVTAGTGATITSSTPFSLTITQSAPTSGTADLVATLDGAIQQNQSSGLVTFSTTSVTIGSDTYAVSNNPLPLVPPSTNNGITSVQARVSGPAGNVPDGGKTALLLGAGLLALTVAGRIWRPALL
jgi:hypothetical protein